MSPSTSPSSSEEKESFCKRIRIPRHSVNMGETASESDRLLAKRLEMFGKQSTEMKEMEKNIKDTIDQPIGPFIARIEIVEEENTR